MTTDVRLLSTYKGFPPQSIISLPDAEATSLVSVNNASLTLTGGTRRYIAVANRDTAAQKLPLGLHTVVQNQQMNVLIPEGQIVILTGDASAVAIVTRNGSSDTWAIAANGVKTIGPYVNNQTLVVQCTAGTVTAENHDAGAYSEVTGETVTSVAYTFTNGAMATMVETAASGRARTTTYAYSNGLATGYSILGFDGRTRTVAYVYTNGQITGKTISGWV